MMKHKSSLLGRIETRLLARKLRAYGLPYHLIAEVLEISISRAFRETRDVVLDKARLPAPKLTLANAVAFLNAEGFEVIAMAAQPSHRAMQAEQRDAA